MSVIYTTDNNDSITIGGTAATGPFPKYSITRSIVELEDGTPIGNRYNISINGTVLTDSDGDITVSGDMQSKLQAKIITKLQTNIEIGHNIGLLEIVPYGGQPNPIVFLDAKLISIDIPEQDDTSSGILYSTYSFTFEATQDISNDAENLFPFALKSAEETWTVNLDPDTTYNDSQTVASTTYTITHTVSATANKKFITGAEFSESAWKQAYGWVRSRLVDSPAGQILTDAIGNTDTTAFTPSIMGDISDDVVSPDLSSFGFYNHIRTPNAGLFNGSYSITETWKASNVPATLDFEVALAQDELENTSITLSGTIIGLDSSTVNSTAIDKLTNAETVLSSVDSSAYTLCNAYYNVSGGALSSVVRSKNIGRNKGTGTISFSYSYNDNTVLIDNAVSTNLRIIDDNEYRLNEIIAIIPIIGKADGPIIQDMGTTNERKRSVQIDAVMNKQTRDSKPAAGKTLALTYAPISDKLQSLVENWEPTTGTYSINVEWIY